MKTLDPLEISWRHGSRLAGLVLEADHAVVQRLDFEGTTAAVVHVLLTAIHNDKRAVWYLDSRVAGRGFLWGPSGFLPRPPRYRSS